MENPKRGVYDPVGKAIKGVCPSMMTHKDQEIDQVVRKYTKGLINSRMGDAPVWRAAANLNPPEMAERDSMSLERCSTEGSYR